MQNLRTIFVFAGAILTADKFPSVKSWVLSPSKSVPNAPPITFITAEISRVECAEIGDFTGEIFLSPVSPVKLVQVPWCYE